MSILVTGEGGDLNGGMVDVSYEVSKKLELAGGIHYDVHDATHHYRQETARKYSGRKQFPKFQQDELVRLSVRD